MSLNVTVCPGFALTPPDTVEACVVTEAEVIKSVTLSGWPKENFMQTNRITALVSFLPSKLGALDQSHCLSHG